MLCFTAEPLEFFSSHLQLPQITVELRRLKRATINPVVQTLIENSWTHKIFHHKGTLTRAQKNNGNWNSSEMDEQQKNTAAMNAAKGEVVRTRGRDWTWRSRTKIMPAVSGMSEPQSRPFMARRVINIAAKSERDRDRYRYPVLSLCKHMMTAVSGWAFSLLNIFHKISIKSACQFKIIYRIFSLVKSALGNQTICHVMIQRVGNISLYIDLCHGARILMFYGLIFLCHATVHVPDISQLNDRQPIEVISSKTL